MTRGILRTAAIGLASIALLVSATAALAARPYLGPVWYVDADTTNTVQNGSKAAPFKTLAQALPAGSCPAATSGNVNWTWEHTIKLKKASNVYTIPVDLTPDPYPGRVQNTVESGISTIPLPVDVSSPLGCIVPPGLKVVGANTTWGAVTMAANRPVINVPVASVNAFHIDDVANTDGNSYTGTGAVLFEDLSFTGATSSGTYTGYFNIVNAGDGITIRNVSFDANQGIYAGSASLLVEGCTFAGAGRAASPSRV